MAPCTTTTNGAARRERGARQRRRLRPARSKLWLATNTLPEVRGQDDAIWRRLRRIPFAQVIRHPDRALPEQLRRELPGVLAWAVRGCAAWHAARGLSEPEQVAEASEDYRAEMDTVAQFIADCCIAAPGASVPGRALYDAYTGWCERQGARPVAEKRFAADAVEKLAKRRAASGVVYDDVEVRR